MALNPKKLEEKYTNRLKDFEKDIDVQLKQHQDYSLSEIDITTPRLMTIEDWKILKPKYIEAGWKGAEWRLSFIKFLS